MIGIHIGLVGSTSASEAEVEDMSSLVFRPGGTASSGVVTTWAGVHAFATAAKAPWVLLIDASLSTPAEVPAGADTDFRGLATIYAGLSPFNYYDLTIRDTGKIRNVAEFKNGTILVEAFTTPGLYASNAATKFSDTAGLASDIAATTHAFEISSAAHVLILDGANPLYSQASGVPVMRYTGASSSHVIIVSRNTSGDMSIYEDNIAGDASASMYVVTDGTSEVPNQALFLGSYVSARNDQSRLMSWSSGVTASRPTNAVIGQAYFDTTLGYQVNFNGTAWVNASGSTV